MTPSLPCRSLGVAAHAIADAAIGRFNHTGYRNRATQQVTLLYGNCPLHQIDQAIGITHPSFALNRRQ
ncbi:MAG: hypothetical protein GDA41_00235 [Rhodospirillales bacterium]|nr:hypothetical protein [Rhodospirillales bacterium]